MVPHPPEVPLILQPHLLPPLRWSSQKETYNTRQKHKK